MGAWWIYTWTRNTLSRYTHELEIRLADWNLNYILCILCVCVFVCVYVCVSVCVCVFVCVTGSFFHRLKNSAPHPCTKLCLWGIGVPFLIGRHLPLLLDLRGFSAFSQIELFSPAVPVGAGTSTLQYCPSSISSADHGVHPSCPVQQIKLKVLGKARPVQHLVVSWCFEAIQPLGITSGLSSPTAGC